MIWIGVFCVDKNSFLRAGHKYMRQCIPVWLAIHDEVYNLLSNVAIES